MFKKNLKTITFVHYGLVTTVLEHDCKSLKKAENLLDFALSVLNQPLNDGLIYTIEIDFRPALLRFSAAIYSGYK